MSDEGRKTSDINMISLAKKLQNLELFLDSQYDKDVGYGRALIEAIVDNDLFIEVEVLKCIGDLHLQKGMLSQDLADFDKAAALYAAALLRCTDPDMGQTLEHRIGYMEKLSSQLQYTPHSRWLPPDYGGTFDNNVLRVVKTCHQLDRSVKNSWRSVETRYTEILVTAIAAGDVLLELEVLKSLGDLFFESGKKMKEVSQFFKAAAMYKKALTICEEPGTTQTLSHRIRYTEKVSEAVNRQSLRNKSRPTKNRSHQRQQCRNITKAEISQDHNLHPDIPRWGKTLLTFVVQAEVGSVWRWLCYSSGWDF
ncbi:uncharacterized protein LOC118430984 [Branchiostoma floridae]|uniref:Uncharacterized protein LOC118430984 n=1 Tax=Branchiostoma floridae TaxID=7739 RepID=A0A9J7NCC6_BRAFL|nr:uncharacterized protein LOC118430984 [Branchiostoma floridae]